MAPRGTHRMKWGTHSGEYGECVLPCRLQYAGKATLHCSVNELRNTCFSADKTADGVQRRRERFPAFVPTAGWQTTRSGHRVVGGRLRGMTATAEGSVVPLNYGARINLRNYPNQDWIVFLGTATSEGVPRVSCLTEQPVPQCHVCVDASERLHSPNRRRNTSLAIHRRRRTQAGRELLAGRTHETVVIDVGKFFYQSAIDVFPATGLRQIDAVVLTHEHADATNGLDDLRDWTLNIGRRHGDGPLSIPVWGDAATLERVHGAFPYLVEPSRATGSGLVPKLSFHQIEAYQRFYPTHPRSVNAANSLQSDRLTPAPALAPAPDCISLLPVPVEHGRDQGCLGFRFGEVVYLSDVSYISPKAMDAIRGCRILIVDALHPGTGSHVSHFCEQQALALVTQLRPIYTFFTGMTHMWDHERDNARLAAWSAAESRRMDGRPVHVALAYDGLCVPVDLEADR